MKISRREVTKILLAAAVAPPGLAANAALQAAAAKTWDVAVIGTNAACTSTTPPPRAEKIGSRR